MHLPKLSYTFFLHQTTTVGLGAFPLVDCLIPFFYIKPQLYLSAAFFFVIVLYLFSTSNHNWAMWRQAQVCIVLYLFSTSNHNCVSNLRRDGKIVLYLFSTSNHNWNLQHLAISVLSYTFFLHQTTTVLL